MFHRFDGNLINKKDTYPSIADLRPNAKHLYHNLQY